jgi:hypothetical protein
VAENNRDGIERGLLTSGNQQVNAQEMLAELVRLVESSRLAPEGSAPTAKTVPEQTRADMEPAQSLEITSPQPLVEVWSSSPGETAAVVVDPPRARESDNSYSNDPNGIDVARGRRSVAWTFKALALVLAGAAGIGSLLWLERVEPGPPKAGPVIAAVQGPATVPPESNLTVLTSRDAGASPPRDVAQPAQGKILGPEERPIGLNARVSANNPPSAVDSGPTAIGVAQPAADASAGKPLAAPVNAPAAAEPIAAPPAMALQSLAPKPVPTVSLPPDPLLPPDPTQIAMPAPSESNPGGAAVHASDAPLPPIRPAPKVVIEAAGVVQRSTPKLDLPTKLSSKSAAHVVVAKTDVNGPSVPAEKPSEALRRPASVNSEKGAKTLKTTQAPAEALAPPSGQPVKDPQSNPNPVVHAFNNAVGAVGALAGLIPFVPH